jgi:prepilin-type N-terminal cleavage/methylation domain-containing protein
VPTDAARELLPAPDPGGDGEGDIDRALATDRGFTLVEILVAVVVVGILASVAVIGVQSLQRNGSLAACESSLDAAKAASVAYYADSSVAAATLTYPTTIDELNDADPAFLELPAAAASPAATDTSFHSAEGWTLEMTTVGTASTPPVFSCSMTA